MGDFAFFRAIFSHFRDSGIFGLCGRPAESQIHYQEGSAEPFAQYGKMRGVPARWGDPARGIPTLLDPVQAEEHNEPPPRPFEPRPPFQPGWAVWAWEYH